MAKKKFKIEMIRTYSCHYEYEAHSKKEIENMINWNTNIHITNEMCEDFWDTLAEKELEQMDVDTNITMYDCKIYEKGKKGSRKRIQRV